MKKGSPYTFFGVVWLVLLIGGFIGVQFFFSNIWLKVFVAANLASFLLYGIDKIQAQINRRRVPEKILYLSAFLGGPIGALAAMHLFRHKTRKLGFQFILALLILIQIGITLFILDQLDILSLELF